MHRSIAVLGAGVQIHLEAQAINPTVGPLACFVDHCISWADATFAPVSLRRARAMCLVQQLVGISF